MDRDWTASFSIRFRNGTCIIILDKKYNIANSSCHFGSYGSIYGPVRHQNNIIWTSEASVHIIFFWWRTGPYTAIWPSVPWTICYIMISKTVYWENCEFIRFIGPLQNLNLFVSMEDPRWQPPQGKFNINENIVSINSRSNWFYKDMQMFLLYSSSSSKWFFWTTVVYDVVGLIILCHCCLSTIKI
jgi:hypothetical protein